MKIPLHLALGAVLMVAVAALFVSSPGVASAQEPGVQPQEFTVQAFMEELNTRSEPNTSAPIVSTISRGDVVKIIGQAAGEEVRSGNAVWFRTSDGNYVYSGSVRPAAAAAAQVDGMSGRWIEVDRSAQVARAIEDGNVVYSAPITVGTQAFPTPTGSYTIQRRVANETMDSATVGIPRDSPDGYYLTGVLYTQYFNNGYSLHYNYWSPPEAFGNYPGSHGCVGLQLADAEFFWNFADIGTPVIINQ